jgi:hypothetical protein
MRYIRNLLAIPDAILVYWRSGSSTGGSGWNFRSAGRLVPATTYGRPGGTCLRATWSSEVWSDAVLCRSIDPNLPVTWSASKAELLPRRPWFPGLAASVRLKIWPMSSRYPRKDSPLLPKKLTFSLPCCWNAVICAFRRVPELNFHPTSLRSG